MADDRPELTSGAPEPPLSDSVADTVVELTREGVTPEDRRRLLRRLAQHSPSSWRAMWRPGEVIHWLVDSITEAAPHIAVRDAETLRRHFPGLTPDALADRLVRNAARTTSAIGAAAGGVATIQWGAPPALLTVPVLLTAETLAVIAVEIKLVGELHEAYGHPIVGTGAQRAMGLLGAWSSSRGVTPLAGVRGMAAVVVSTGARSQLREQIAKRFGRNLTTLGPFLSGAVAAGYLNRRATRKLGEAIRKDLKGRVLPPGQ